ncbi:MAG: MerR family transcriptional regulator [Micrococcales bacterium]|nr:MerR family transcriptional regulator [Micrococcales bacterium]
MSDSYLGIGDFSRFAMLSVRMLRHYDERGLLVPAYVDPHNGYRFYAPAQLRTAGRIRALRDAGCGIPQIAELLPLFDDADALRQALADHGRRLGAAAQAIAEQQSLLDTITTHLEEPSMSITVETRDVPARRILSHRSTVASYAAEAELWAGFENLMKTGAIDPAQLDAGAGATFFDEEFRGTDIDMAIWVEYRGDTAPDGWEITTMPAQKVAWATMYGQYEGDAEGRRGMEGVCEAIGTWVADHGYTVTGPMYNVYIISPGDDANPDSWVTEVSYPIG